MFVQKYFDMCNRQRAGIQNLVLKSKDIYKNKVHSGINAGGDAFPLFLSPSLFLSISDKLTFKTPDSCDCGWS